MAVRIQAREITRCGELLKQIERSEKGGRPENEDRADPVSRTGAATDAGSPNASARPRCAWRTARRWDRASAKRRSRGKRTRKWESIGGLYASELTNDWRIVPKKTPDAPEHAQPYGHGSRQSLIALCRGEAAHVDGYNHDPNGRMLAHVRCNGVDTGAEQVRRGMAWVFVRYAPADSPLYAIEEEAQATRRGLWATLQPVPPWEWRGR